MASYLNFYETVQEANMRLRNTVVLYDKEPFFVLGVSNHISKGEEATKGEFRIYLTPFPYNQSAMKNCPAFNMPMDHPLFGPSMDNYLDQEEGKKAGVIRKKMSSNLFNQFRPFPLGFLNKKGELFYLERTPKRKTEQGLAAFMLAGGGVDFGIGLSTPTYNENFPRDLFNSAEMRDTILGIYPSLDEILAKYNSDSIVNKGVAFARDYAIVRGPVETLFLAHKRNVVGILPERSRQTLILSKEFFFLKEQIEATKYFVNIK